MNPTAITVSLVPEARGGPFILWDDISTSCAKAKALGYDAIELFAPSPEAVREASAVVRREGLALAAAGTGAGWVRHKLSISDPDPEIRARARRSVVEMIDAAAPAPALLGSMQGRAKGPWIADALREFDAEAGRRGATFLLEPLNRYEGTIVNTLAEGVEMIRGLSHTKLLADGYLWTGAPRTRSFAEWRLLRRLREWDLPVPQPVAARYVREGFTYRADLITVELPVRQTLASLLTDAPLPAARWSAVGSCVGRLHARGVHHADLNAHNLLLGDGDAVYVLDFDRGRLRRRGAWEPRVLARLRRSLLKVTAELPRDRFGDDQRRALLAGAEE